MDDAFASDPQPRAPSTMLTAREAPVVNLFHSMTYRDKFGPGGICISQVFAFPLYYLLPPPKKVHLCSL